MSDVLITEDLIADSIKELARNHKVTLQPALWSKPELAHWISDARTVMIRNQTKLTRAIIESAPKLLAIGRVGVGLDNIDLQAANDHGVVVIAPLDANAVSVAELTLGLIIALARKIPMADRSTKSGGWDRRGCTGIELDGKTLLIVGYGRIGKQVATRAKAFGMRTLIFDPFVKSADITNLDEALPQSDFISVHVPLTNQTRNLINTPALAKLKPSAFVINTARGGIIDETALLAALNEKRIAGAALDVRETEPPTGENSFAKFDNVILTPHIASFTHEAQTRTFEAVCADLDRILRGEPAVNFVNFARPKK
jgi:D-3-phosphoglycerate dehydrogenase / 2-oxoglutarate reductase